MLREWTGVHQTKGRPRRWFSDDFFELIVWLDPDGSIWGFQLCYDKEGRFRSLTWAKDKGYCHCAVDDGSRADGAHPASPILLQDGLFDAKAVGARLAGASKNLPPEIRSIILEKISRYEA
jgi:hypothetical protein